MPKSSLCQIRLRGVDTSAQQKLHRLAVEVQKAFRSQHSAMRPWKITRIYPSEFDEKQQAEGDHSSALVMFFNNAKSTFSEHFRFFRCWTLGIVHVKKLNESRRIHHLCMAESLMYI